MFERFTEKARRVIFFARFEASQYGSPFIETEHMLLGLLREDNALARHFLRPHGSIEAVRREVEASITLREKISTSVEMPLTEDCKKILNLAVEESDKLGHKYIGTEHLLLGMLMVQGSFAFEILRKWGIKPETVRDQLAKSSAGEGVKAQSRPSNIGIRALHDFLAALKESSAVELSRYFAKSVQLVDYKGTHWDSLEEIDLEAFLAPYSKKNVGYRLEKTGFGPSGSIVASVLWENVTMGSESKRPMHRMTVILVKESDTWLICFVQVTPLLAH
jgi:Clp amino terminal domain, pathogenicity island component